jgi:hypothetical protein
MISGLPVAQSVMTLISISGISQLFMISGVVNACHTCDGRALIVTTLLNIFRPVARVSLLIDSTLVILNGNKPIDADVM